MKVKRNLNVIPSEYYDSIIFREKDLEKIKANDFINELIDMALNYHVYNKVDTKEDK
ncbi:MAG: hypothetical protein GX963_12935 [Bacteroidales bacterium]|nr:hypothetical protein [Bacteroidales bacterium]